MRKIIDEDRPQCNPNLADMISLIRSLISHFKREKIMIEQKVENFFGGQRAFSRSWLFPE